MRNRKGLCQICGETRELTTDHIPQKSLYPKSIRSSLRDQMNTVQACSPCNNAQNEVDEFLKVVVGMIADAPWKNDVTASVKSTLDKNGRLLKVIAENTRRDEIDTERGKWPADVFKIPADYAEQLLASVERIVKGLFYQEFGQVLVIKYNVSHFHPSVVHPDLRAEIEEALMEGDWQSLNDNTFHYCFVHVNRGDIVCVVNLFENLEFCFCIIDKTRLNRGVRGNA